jgi:restriction endonuclease S subunit
VSDFKLYTFTDVCNVYQPETIAKKSLPANGLYPVYGANGKIGLNDKFNHEEPQLLLGCRGSVGSIHISEPFSWINGNAMVVKPFEDLVTRDYLKYALLGGIKIGDAISGTAQPQITRESLSKIKIPVPTIEKQLEIVEKLDSAFAEIEELHRNGLRALGNIEMLLSQLIGSWIKSGSNSKKVNLGELAELKGRIGWRGLTAKEYTKQGPLFLSVHSLNHGHYVDFSQAFHITQERYDESPEIHLDEGYILIAKDGAGLGKVGMVGPITQSATVNSSLLVVKPKVGIQTKYLYCYFLSSDFKDLVKDRLAGSTVPHLYQRDIAKIPVTYLSTEEQNDFVAKFDLASTFIESFSEKLKRRNQLILELKGELLSREFEAS